ncbi:MAG: PTS sugar transporter subunit IIA [Candidatus Sumerlaeia bacterium]|nr:PTS sugar transporter subunit IIA [Candidatus Sumerlaeia bacterium]
MPYDPRQMFSPDRVVDLHGSTKDEVLTELCAVLAKSDKVSDPKELLARIIEREKTLSTGVGVGLALPHVKIPSIADFVIAIGRHLKGVDFQSLDNKPAHIIVMIGCHESQSADYLKVLSKLVRALKEREFQKKILLAGSPQEIVDLFIGDGGVFVS